jgi:hypothetical protein
MGFGARGKIPSTILKELDIHESYRTIASSVRSVLIDANYIANSQNRHLRHQMSHLFANIF